MAMCVYDYVFDLHVIGGGDQGAYSGIYFRGAPCIGEGSGEPPRSLAGPGQCPVGGPKGGEGCPHEAPGNWEYEELMIIMTT